MDWQKHRQEEDSCKGTVFQELKVLCPQLFQLLEKDKQKSKEKDKESVSLLDRLKAYVREAPVHGLQPCLDYVIFPLLLLLDASVAYRSTNSSQGRDGGPFMISDSVAEGGLSCLEEVLKRCSLTSIDQLSMLLKKLTSGALLSPSEASEEFRHGIVKCLSAVLLGLKPCLDEACTCKTVPLSPFFISNLGLLCNMKDAVVSNLQTKVVNGYCLIAFLQSENASAAVGHLLSLLLQIAETEARRGHRGSGKLRADSISTLRVLISKVGSADALAFFMPGIVSGLTKVLRGSKSTTVESFQPTSGAAGSIGTIEQAVKGLGEILVLCLADEQNPTLLNISVAETYNKGVSGILSRNYESADSALEALRCLSLQMHAKKDIELAKEVPFHSLHGKQLQQNKDGIGKPQGYGIGEIGSNFHVYRDEEWLEQTARHVDSFLSSIFPVLCTHPARVVRLGLAEAAGALLSMCTNTLKRIKPMLLECLLALACDDWESVSLIAHDYLSVLFSLEGRFMQENELNTVFSRLIQRFPRAILRGDETTALTDARRLLAAMFFSGPQVVSRHLFESPAAIGFFLDAMKQSLSHTLAFTGPIEDMVNHRAQSAGHLLVISELSSDTATEENGVCQSQASPRKLDSHALQLEESEMSKYFENMAVDEHLPRMPPWFNHAGGQKLYELIAAIIRLAGLSAVAGCTETFSLSILIEIPLEALRHIISELHVKEYKEEDWFTWYDRHRSDCVLRDAATAVCLLSEIIFGASSRSISTYPNLLKISSRLQDKSIGGIERMPHKCDLNNYLSKNIPHSLQKWKMSTGTGLNKNVIECIGNICHEYLSSEIWDLPIDFSSPGQSQCSSSQQLPWHFFQDTAMLQQVILEGLGVFGISLGKYFETSGFLYSSLYLLLEKVACSNYHMQRAADMSLRTLSISVGYLSIKDMVVSNMDYIIDSLCRQLRHLTLNPRAPNILAALLSTCGASRDILPLLEEPMRSISLDLEVLARQQHPDLTVPILKALDKIVKVLRREAHSVTQESLWHGWHINLEVEYLKEKQKLLSESSDLSVVMSSGSCKEKTDTFFGTDASEESKFSGYVLSFEHWEEVLSAINDRKRYRHSMGTVVGLCLKASIPLLGSQEQEACLKALDIVQNAATILSMIEEALNSEIKSREAIEWVADQFSFHALQDIINHVDAGQDANLLLPAMNKIWPYLVACLKHTKHLVVIRCFGVLANAISVCGGDFFVRRFKADGSYFLKLLSCTSRTQFQEDIAQGTILKVQGAFFQMIAAISRDKKSACALQAIFKQMAGLAVGFSCASTRGPESILQQTATDALFGLSNIDPDFIWLLVADIVYSTDSGKVPSPPCPDLPHIAQLLPKSGSSKEHLWVQYAGQDYSLKCDVLLARKLLDKIDSGQDNNLGQRESVL